MHVQGGGAAGRSRAPMTVGWAGEASAGTVQPVRQVTPRPFRAYLGRRNGDHSLTEAEDLSANLFRRRQPGGGALRQGDFSRAGDEEDRTLSACHWLTRTSAGLR